METLKEFVEFVLVILYDVFVVGAMVWLAWTLETWWVAPFAYLCVMKYERAHPIFQVQLPSGDVLELKPEDEEE